MRHTLCGLSVGMVWFYLSLRMPIGVGLAVPVDDA